MQIVGDVVQEVRRPSSMHIEVLDGNRRRSPLSSMSGRTSSILGGAANRQASFAGRESRGSYHVSFLTAALHR